MGKDGLKIAIIAWTQPWLKGIKHWNSVRRGKLPNETGFIAIYINYVSQERGKKDFPKCPTALQSHQSTAQGNKLIPNLIKF